MNSIPRVDRAAEHQDRLEAIPGNVPNPLYLPEGCAFHPRCRFATDECKQAIPALEDTGNGHMVRCIRWKDLDLKQEMVA
jgi:oligopeptide/dipeptide ABC transporter ATP-binding protein